MRHVRVSDSMNIDAVPKANADMCMCVCVRLCLCACVFTNVTKEEDKEDQLVDRFVSATVQTATGNKRSTVIICISLPAFCPVATILKMCTVLKCHVHIKACNYSSWRDSRFDRGFIQIWHQS